MRRIARGVFIAGALVLFLIVCFPPDFLSHSVRRLAHDAAYCPKCGGEAEVVQRGVNGSGEPVVIRKCSECWSEYGSN